MSTKKLATVLGEMFTADERADIRRRAKEKVAGIQLQKVREARHFTQAEAAQAMGVSQAALSKMERRPNVTVGALQRYVEALGGRLEVHVVLPDSRRARRIDARSGQGSRPRPGRSGKRIALITA